ncbi:MAG: ribosome recycling factor [Opitutales bacterium]
MTSEQIIPHLKAELNKAVDHTLHEFHNIHTGKASPSLVENVTVQCYGSNMQLKAVAAITTPDARTISIQPFDKGTLNDIIKGIQQANLGLNPVAMGDKVHVPLPDLTKERRQQLVKTCQGHAEQGKVGVRAARREAMDAVKKAEKDKEISEDDRKRLEKEIQAEHDKSIKQIDEALKAKEAELLQV